MTESHPVPGLQNGTRVRATITAHHPWGFMAVVQGHESVGASLDLIRRQHEPGVHRLGLYPPEVGAVLDLIIGEVRIRQYPPQVWLDLTTE